MQRAYQVFLGVITAALIIGGCSGNSGSDVNPAPVPMPPIDTGNGFIPSLYGYSHGRNAAPGSSNIYRVQLHSFCESTGFTQALQGPDDLGQYATTIYNLRRPQYAKNPENFNEQIDWLLDCARKTGRLRVIINFNFYESPLQKSHLCETTQRSPDHAAGCPDNPDGSAGYNPANIDDALAAFELLLGDNGPDNLELTFSGSGHAVLAGISLAEENATWDYKRKIVDGQPEYSFERQMRSDLLNNLYAKLKQTYDSKLQFFQWYSPHRKIINYPGATPNWPVIDADGWVFDQYLMPAMHQDGNFRDSDYYEFVKNTQELGKPMFGIVWASPLRYPSREGRGKLNFDWWDAEIYEDRPGGWRNLQAQLAVNQTFDVHTIYYALTPDPSGRIGYDIPMTRQDLPPQCGRNIFGTLTNSTMPYVQSNKVPPVTGNVKPAWIPSAPQDCSDDRVMP